jgi:hypothetical protein
MTPEEARRRVDELFSIRKQRQLTHEEQIEAYILAIDSQADATYEVGKDFFPEARKALEEWCEQKMRYRRWQAALPYAEKVKIAEKMIEMAEEFRNIRELQIRKPF